MALLVGATFCFLLLHSIHEAKVFLLWLYCYDQFFCESKTLLTWEATHATIFFFRLFVVAFPSFPLLQCWLWLLLYLVVHKLKRTLAYLILFPLQQSQIKKTLVNIWTLKYERGNSCFHKEGARTINWNKSGGSSKEDLWWRPLPSPSSSSSPKNVMSVSSFYGFQGEMREWKKIKEKHGKPSL